MHIAPNSTNTLVDRIDAWLPQTQCTQCGYPRCRAYAEAIARGEAGINRCPPGGEVTIDALATLQQISPTPLDPRYGQHHPRRRAVIDETVCIGCRKCLDVCPVDAILGAHKKIHTVIAADCSGCELCLPPCPVDCITMITAPPSSTGEHWPEYTRTETERWRDNTERRLQRLQRRKQKRLGSREAVRRPRHTPSVLPDNRAQIRAEIHDAVEHSRKKKTRGLE